MPGKPSVGRHTAFLLQTQNSCLSGYDVNANVPTVFVASSLNESIKQRHYFICIKPYLFKNCLQKRSTVRQKKNGIRILDVVTSGVTILLDRGCKYWVSHSHDLQSRIFPSNVALFLVKFLDLKTTLIREKGIKGIPAQGFCLRLQNKFLFISNDKDRGIGIKNKNKTHF